MANNSKAVNFGFGSQPDLQLEQVKLQRQQALIDALRKDSLTPMESQTVSGAGPAQVVKTNPLLGVANLGKAYFAGQMQDEADKKIVALGEEGKKRMADALRSLAPAGTFDDAQPVISKPGQLGSGMMDALPPPAEGVMPNMPAASTVDPTTKQAWVTALKAMQFNPELGNKLVENASTLTTEQKNMSAMGQDPRLMGALAIAEARKKAMLEMQPGNTVLDLSNNNRMVAPDFKTGIAGGYSANGMPTMARIQGSENISDMAGETARKEAIGKAGGETMEITDPDGNKRVVLRSDVLNQAAAPNPAMPSTVAPNPQMPKSSNNGVNFNGDERLKLITQEYQNRLAPPDDPRKAGDLVALQREMSKLSGGASSRGGIPIQSEAQKEAQVGAEKVKNAVEEAKLKNAQSQDNQQKIVDAESVLGLLSSAEPLIKKATGSSVGYLRDQVGGLVGISTDASKAASKLSAIGGSLISKMPKMSGPQSDKDALLYKQMAGQIGDPTIPDGNKLAALQTIKELNQKYLSQNVNSVANKAIESTRSNNQPAATPIGAIDYNKLYGIKTK